MHTTLLKPKQFPLANGSIFNRATVCVCNVRSEQLFRLSSTEHNNLPNDKTTKELETVEQGVGGNLFLPSGIDRELERGVSCSY